MKKDFGNLDILIKTIDLVFFDWAPRPLLINRILIEPIIFHVKNFYYTNGDFRKRISADKRNTSNKAFCN